ncbi:uncharacterized protein A4U43_C07F39120 [Asparagus officinalis]|uniref:J domain-containing protein n=1 Tax=Asparagus officinalis TaxID=4686 RepID=A0A5P1EKC8_ASPOF|nr:uncharacterized protein LOC109849251 [Asparagus officinalis]ONK65637.1 uncharacterized protein A4U43_C07F39120 [Asparagus officinalis]
MECRKEEAEKALKLAEEKFKANDLQGAKRFALKAQSIYPSLPNLTQTITAYGIHVLAATKSDDWHSILGVSPDADHETIKKQYKKLCMLTHPDKNRSAAAEGATKIILQAWSVLSTTRTPSTEANFSVIPGNFKALRTCGRCRRTHAWEFKLSSCRQCLLHRCKNCGTWSPVKEPTTNYGYGTGDIGCSCGGGIGLGPYKSLFSRCTGCNNHSCLAIDLSWMPTQKPWTPEFLACPRCGGWNIYFVENSKYHVDCSKCGASSVIGVDVGSSSKSSGGKRKRSRWDQH